MHRADLHGAQRKQGVPRQRAVGRPYARAPTRKWCRQTELVGCEELDRQTPTVLPWRIHGFRIERITRQRSVGETWIVPSFRMLKISPHQFIIIHFPYPNRFTS